MTQTPVSDTPALLMNLSLVNPHDGSTGLSFTDDGTLDALLVKLGAPGVPLLHWIPEVTETDEWNPDVWIRWVENMQHFASTLPAVTEPKLEVKPKVM